MFVASILAVVVALVVIGWACVGARVADRVPRVSQPPECGPRSGIGDLGMGVPERLETESYDLANTGFRRY